MFSNDQIAQATKVLDSGHWKRDSTSAQKRGTTLFGDQECCVTEYIVMPAMKAI